MQTAPWFGSVVPLLVCPLSQRPSAHTAGRRPLRLPISSPLVPIDGFLSGCRKRQIKPPWNVRRERSEKAKLVSFGWTASAAPFHGPPDLGGDEEEADRPMVTKIWWPSVWSFWTKSALKIRWYTSWRFRDLKWDMMNIIACLNLAPKWASK